MTGKRLDKARRREPSFALALLPVVSLAGFLGTG